MTKEIRFCLNADEVPSLPGAYAMAIEFADKVAVTLSGRSLIVFQLGAIFIVARLRGRAD